MTTTEGFDLDKAMAQGWEQFEARIGEVLSVMDEPGTGLCIDAVEGGSVGMPCVRCGYVGDDRLRVEASSNASLDDEWLLSADALQRMEDAGWQAPSAEGDRDFVTTGTRTDAATLARRIVVALRDCYGVPHPAFLAPDQLCEILTLRHAAPATSYEPEDVHATVPADATHLEALVHGELVDFLGHPPLRDHDGDFAIRVGSAMVFVRVTPDAKEVLVFSVVVHDIAGRSRAAEVLNDLNSECRFVRFELIKDQVFVQMSVLAHPFVPAHLHQALTAVSEVADGADEALARKLDGRTTFGA